MMTQAPHDSAPNAALPRLLLVELNEFNPDFLRVIAERWGLRNILQVLSWPRTTTTTDDKTEHHGLDPWVQWVSVHCGRPSAEHGVRRLGDTRRQTAPQLWHAVAEAGGSWGVWGVMNAPLGKADGCAFFMPDPWSFEEQAYPPALNDLLALPRYVSKNYLEIDYAAAFWQFLRLIKFFAPPNQWPIAARFAKEAIAATPRAGVSVHTFTTLLDYLSVLCFVQARRKSAPNLSLIFLNYIAHLQHQFWTEGDRPHPQMELGLRLSDAMLGLLLKDRVPGEAMIVMNCFRQKNVARKGHFVYRQKVPERVVRDLGIEGARVEQSMTHDAHLLFAEPAHADRALAQLQAVTLEEGTPVFFAERAGPARLFYQLEVERAVPQDAKLRVGNRALRFYDLFELVCERTGAHLPEGDLYADGIGLPPAIAIHRVYAEVLSYFSNTRRRADAA
jgi:hypothetical protein